MTQAIQISAPARPADEGKVIGLVSAAHFASHYFMLLLPPLFPFVRAEYGVSYTELGIAFAAFNIVSAGLQTPAGFLTDRIGAANILVAGLTCSSVAFALAALVPSYWFMVAMFALAGLGNTVYHPADYSILSHRIAAERIGSAYSVHTFAGMVGASLAPATALTLEGVLGWRGAFLSATLLGGVIAVVLVAFRDLLAPSQTSADQRPRAGSGRVSWRLLTTGSLVRNLIFFMMLSLVGYGLQTYSAVALMSLHDMSLSLADGALTGYLLLTALGVLLGGLVAQRTTKHDFVATIGLTATAAALILVPISGMASWVPLMLMSAAGLFSGMISPSRDMIVRQTTPPGAFGTVFGFVSTGFNLSGIFAPLLFGWFMDHGYPSAIFVLGAAFSLITVPLLFVGVRRERDARVRS